MNPAPSRSLFREPVPGKRQGIDVAACPLAAPGDHGFHQSGADADATRPFFDITALDPPAALAAVRSHGRSGARQSHDGVVKLPDIDGRVGGCRIHPACQDFIRRRVPYEGGSSAHRPGIGEGPVEQLETCRYVVLPSGSRRFHGVSLAALPDRSIGPGVVEELLGPVEDGAAVAMRRLMAEDRPQFIRPETLQAAHNLRGREGVVAGEGGIDDDGIGRVGRGRCAMAMRMAMAMRRLRPVRPERGLWVRQGRVRRGRCGRGRGGSGIGRLTVEESAHPADHIALRARDDELPDNACVAHVGLETLASSDNESGELLRHRQRHADRGQHQEVERATHRILIRLRRGVRLRIGVVRHSPGRADSSCRPADSGA